MRRHRDSLLVLVIALAVKGAVLYALADHPLLQPRGEMDSAVYLDLATSGVPPEPYFVSPLYVYFLKAAGGSVTIARAAQIALGAIAVLLQFQTALLWFGRRGGWITATLALLTGVTTFNEITILQSALDPILVSAMLFALTLALQRNVSRAYVFTGITTALFVLNRPNALIWAAALIALLLLQKRRKQAGLVVAAIVVTLLPVAARNLIVARELVLISSHGGLNFYIGNHEEATGTYQAIRGIRPTIKGQSEDAEAMAERALGREPSSAEVSQWFYAQSFRWIRQEPGAATALLLRKLAYTVHQTDLPLNYSYAFFAEEEPSPLRFMFVGAWLLLPLGLAGAMTKRERDFAPLLAFVPVYALSVALFFVSSRYRLPLFVPLAIFAAGVSRVRLAPKTSAAAAIAGVILACWPFNLDDGRSLEKTNMVALMIEERQFDDAERLLVEYAPEHEEPSRLRHRAAIAYLSVDEPERAIPLFQSVLRDERAQPVLRSSATDELIRMYLKTNRADEARALLSTVDAAKVSAARATTLGRLALDARDSKRALLLLRSAVSRDPANALAWQLLGVALLAENDASGAIDALTRSRRLQPRDVDTVLFLGVAHQQIGDVERARAFAIEALKIDARFPAAQRLLEQTKGGS